MIIEMHTFGSMKLNWFCSSYRTINSLMIAGLLFGKLKYFDIEMIVI